MSTATDKEQARVRVTRVVESAIYEANLYTVMVMFIVYLLVLCNVWTWVIGIFVMSIWLLSDYFKDKAVKKAVDKLLP